MEKTVTIALIFLIAVLVLSLFSNYPPAYSQPIAGEPLTTLFNNIKSARARYASSEGDEGTIGFRVLGEESVDGEPAWKSEWELTAKGSEPVHAIIWVSKSTGMVVQAEMGGEVQRGEFAELMTAPLLALWNVWFISQAEAYTPERIAEYGVSPYGRLSSTTELMSIGPTTLWVYKISWEGFPTAPEHLRNRWDFWYAPTSFGMLLVRVRVETLDGSKWFITELLSVELTKPQQLPRVVVKAGIDKTRLQPGEQAVVTVEYANQGSAVGLANITLAVDGEVKKKWFIAPKPGETGTLTHSLSFTKEGNYTVRVGNETFLVVVSAAKPKPAKFEVSELAVNPSSPKPGERVEISVRVTNTGGEAGSYEVVLKVDGQPVDTKSVRLEPGASTKVTFSYTPRGGGTYEINVNGLRGTLTVTEEEKVEKPEERVEAGIPWLLIAAVAAAVVIAVVVVVLLKQKSRKPSP